MASRRRASTATTSRATCPRRSAARVAPMPTKTTTGSVRGWRCTARPTAREPPARSIPRPTHSMNDKKLPRTRLPRDARLDTLAVREGLPPSQWGENSEALFVTSSFVHPDAATAAARFANEEEAFVYSRFTNPTVTMMERRLAALEGSEACIGTASGMGAITMIVLGLLKAGDHVICSHKIGRASCRERV